MAGTVSVACKLPHGLQLRVFDMITTSEPVMGGGMRDVKTARQVGEPVIIKGNAHPQNEAPRAEISSGYAITHGVDKDFWDLWVAQNASHEAVRNGLIFAHEKPDAINRMSAEKAKIKSGLEPISPDSDMRVPRQVKTDDGKGK